QFPERKIDIDALKIVLTRPSNFDASRRGDRGDALFFSKLRPHWRQFQTGNEFANFRALFPESRSESLALIQKFLGHDATEGVEKLFVLDELGLPFFVIDLEQFVDAFVIHLKLGQIEIVNPGQPTYW